MSKSLHYLLERFPKAFAWQLVAEDSVDRTSTDGIRTISVVEYLRGLV